MYDHVDTIRAPPAECPQGCAMWSDLASDGNTRDQSDVDAKWLQGVAPKTAQRNCAGPSNDPGSYGSWCYCAKTHDASWGYCVPNQGVPEQINLQVANGDTVVVSFVTFEDTAPENPPFVVLDGKRVEGVTHEHKTPAGTRTLYMHFVRLSGLEPRKKYPYTVSSGGKTAHLSETQEFRAPYSSGETRLNIFGDMGVYQWTNMGNLLQDCEDGTADAVIHMGDHAYNEGQNDEKRGDGYMNMYSKILSQCPWVPVVGNHEYYSSEYIKRYQDSTWQHWDDVKSLQALLTGGTLHAGSSQSVVPSGSARWFSVDFGLVHWISLDLNLYFGTDDGSAELKQQQADWLTKDLAEANANRATRPWIVAGSHYPFYCSECANQFMTADWYANGFVFQDGVEREHPPMNETQLKEMASAKAQCAAGLLCDERLNLDVRASTDAAIKDLMPIIDAGGVDLYLSGHWHYYQSFWPMGVPQHGTGASPQQESFENPRSTVHILTGNGGPPGKDTMNSPSPALRLGSNKYGYGRITAYNSSHLQFEQVLNGYDGEGEPGEVMDAFMVVQTVHGPFSNVMAVI